MDESKFDKKVSSVVWDEEDFSPEICMAHIRIMPTKRNKLKEMITATVGVRKQLLEKIPIPELRDSMLIHDLEAHLMEHLPLKFFRETFLVDELLDEIEQI